MLFEFRKKQEKDLLKFFPCLFEPVYGSQKGKLTQLVDSFKIALSVHSYGVNPSTLNYKERNLQAGPGKRPLCSCS